MRGIATAAERLPVLIGGAGPAGVTTAIGLRRAGASVIALEARGSDATRARNVWLRPQAREILTDLLGSDPGRDSTIMSLENRLRSVARTEGTDVRYGQRVLDVRDVGSHVEVVVEDAASSARQTLRGRAFVDATGGRLAATSVGDLARVPVSKSHVYVTAQYDGAPRFDSVHGLYDRGRDEALVVFPISDGSGFVTYFDQPVGRAVGDERALLARWNAIEGALGLGTPVSRPQAFDAQQHLSRNASAGRLLKIGDSAGNADPYIGAGVAAALVDARAAAAQLAKVDDDAVLVGQAARDVLAGHRKLGDQAQLMVRARPLVMRLFPSASLDETVRSDSFGRSRVLDGVAQFLTSRPI